MPGPEPQPQPSRPAERDSWPALAALLAPAAGCDCQMMAVSLVARIDGAPRPARKIAER